MSGEAFASVVAAATSILAIALCCAAVARGESSRVATPVHCGLVAGAPWTVVSSAGTSRGTRYYLTRTANLSCSELSKRVARLSHLTASGLRGSSVRVSTGERLRCLTVAVPRGIRRLSPAAAWGWCGTDVGRAKKFGVRAAAGTEFFWVTADKRRRSF